MAWPPEQGHDCGSAQSSDGYRHYARMDATGESWPRGWISWDDGVTWDERHGSGTYTAAIEGPEDGPPAATFESHDLAETLAWARARTRWIMVRPSWDQGRYYWAGDSPPPEPGPEDDPDEVVLQLPVPPWPTA